MNEAINSSQVNEYKNLENHVLIDVRETDELEQTGFVPGAVHYPLSSFEDFIDEFDKDKTYIVMCHSGGRSRNVQEYLQGLGYKAINVEGGITLYDGEVEYL